MKASFSGGGEVAAGWLMERLRDVSQALAFLTSEDGTTREQDELLFCHGFKADLHNVPTECGSTVNIERRADGLIYVSNGPDVRKRFLDAGIDKVIVDRIGTVFVPPLSQEEQEDLALRQEIGGIFVHLPKWARETLAAAWKEKKHETVETIETELADEPGKVWYNTSGHMEVTWGGWRVDLCNALDGDLCLTVERENNDERFVDLFVGCEPDGSLRTTAV